MPKPRVIIADDHTLLVEAFEKLLAPECDVIAKVPDGRALITAARELHPDVVVLDIAMPLLNGLDAARQIKQTDPSDQAGVRDDERRSRSCRGGIPRRRVRVSPETLCRRRTADGHPGSDEAPILRDPAGHRRDAGVTVAPSRSRARRRSSPRGNARCFNCSPRASR